MQSVSIHFGQCWARSNHRGSALRPLCDQTGSLNGWAEGFEWTVIWGERLGETEENNLRFHIEIGCLRTGHRSDGEVGKSVRLSGHAPRGWGWGGGGIFVTLMGRENLGDLGADGRIRVLKIILMEWIEMCGLLLSSLG